MNEPREEMALIKELFDKAVKQYGGSLAAGVCLEVSRQRVDALRSAKDEFRRDIPTWAQVWALEQRLGRSVVFAGLADAINPLPPHRTASPLTETMDVIRVAAEIGPLAMAAETGDPASVQAFLDKLEELARELCEAKASTANVKRAAGLKAVS
jgi:hypothetical protein